MRLPFVAVLVASAVIATPAFAHLVEVRGGGDCQAWNAARPGKAQVLEAWVLGYLSGLSQASDHEMPAQYTAASIATWIDRYCKAKPKHPLPRAAFALSGEISLAIEAEQEKAAKAAQAAKGTDKAAPQPAATGAPGASGGTSARK